MTPKVKIIKRTLNKKIQSDKTSYKIFKVAKKGEQFRQKRQ
ncbi:hypothetical protein LEP1GSC082_0108 [Leptospira kirschneri str. H2]|nr:hypothetical protein LEP1GSC082_0108 [Leptospira kirschneri str. H2]